MTLSKTIKTHYILVREWEKNQIKKIPITTAQFNLYEEELQTKKHNDFFKIEDIDTQEVLYNGRASKIEWFEQIKKDTSLQGAVWICSFWTRHPLSMAWKCNCSKEYDTLWILFKDKLKELWYNVSYDNDITFEMQQAYKNKYLR